MTKEQVQEYLITRVYEFWLFYDRCNNCSADYDCMLKEITTYIKAETIESVQSLLDWCRDAYDLIHDEYGVIDLSTIEEKLYNELAYYNDLQKIWDILNWYQDYVDGSMELKVLENLIKEV